MRLMVSTISALLCVFTGPLATASDVNLTAAGGSLTSNGTTTTIGVTLLVGSEDPNTSFPVRVVVKTPQNQTLGGSLWGIFGSGGSSTCYKRNPGPGECSPTESCTTSLSCLYSCSPSLWLAATGHCAYTPLPDLCYCMHPVIQQPYLTVPGVYDSVVIIVDPDSEVDELDESDNQLTLTKS